MPRRLSVPLTAGSRLGRLETAVFSLYATKNVMSGEGGMITTESDAIADRLRLLRNHGMRNRYEYEMLGYNFRLTDVLAAIGVAQMGRLDEALRRRRTNADYLNGHLRGVGTPVVKEGRDHVWHQYTVRLPHGSDRSDVVRRLTAAGIGTGVFIPLARTGSRI